MTWTPSQGPDVIGYTIYYQQQDGGPSGSVEAGQHETSITVPGLIVGATYSISIASTSSTLPSTVTTGPNVTIGTLFTHFTKPCVTIRPSVDGLYRDGTVHISREMHKQCFITRPEMTSRAPKPFLLPSHVSSENLWVCTNERPCITDSVPRLLRPRARVL